MASIQAGPLPSSYSAPQQPKNDLSAASSYRLLPAGPAYLDHLRLTLKHNGSFETHDAHNEKERQRLQDLEDSAANGEDDMGVGEEPEPAELLSLDPKEWKVRKSTTNPHQC